LLFYVLIAPWLVNLVVFVIGPVLSSLYLSFTQYNIVNPAVWVGLANYQRLFSADPLFYQSLRVTTIWVVAGVPLRLAAALFFAMLLNQKVPAVGFFRTVYLPALRRFRRGGVAPLGLDAPTAVRPLELRAAHGRLARPAVALQSELGLARPDRDEPVDGRLDHVSSSWPGCRASPPNSTSRPRLMAPVPFGSSSP